MFTYNPNCTHAVVYQIEQMIPKPLFVFPMYHRAIPNTVFLATKSDWNSTIRFIPINIRKVYPNLTIYVNIRAFNSIVKTRRPTPSQFCCNMQSAYPSAMRSILECSIRLNGSSRVL